MRRARPLRLLVILPLLAAGGCVTIDAPPYGPQVANTLALREAGLQKVKIGEVHKDAAARHDVDHIKARAATVASPYGSYTAYLREALAAEFDHADLLDAGSPLRIDGVLLQNELADSGARGFTLVEMDLTVSRDGVSVYHSKKSARYEWDTEFLGAVAIPHAIANYEAGVQRLIAAYIADPEFVAALRKR